eukprot:maker-scaffold76_size406464-snap-gene-1.12 protein:Tk10231 transcript:maker-scaffold76_size406464-snap-gene-1.12-mRNA-1 annotation:"hypothetical protein MELLADRAFT_110747"
MKNECQPWPSSTESGPTLPFRETGLPYPGSCRWIVPCWNPGTTVCHPPAPTQPLDSSMPAPPVTTTAITMTSTRPSTSAGRPPSHPSTFPPPPRPWRPRRARTTLLWTS